MKKLSFFFKTFFYPIIVLSLILSHIKIYGQEVQDVKDILPEGIYRFYGELTPISKVTVISLNHNQHDDAVKIKQYRYDGYTCLRKNQTVTLCRLTEPFDVVPQELQELAHQKLDYLIFDFQHIIQEPSPLIDTSTQKEWWVQQNVILAETPIHYYKLIYLYDKKTYYCSFPTSEEQGIGILQIANKKDLLLSINLMQTEDNKTVSFFTQAHFFKERL